MAAECDCGVSKFDQLSKEDSHKMILTHSSPIVFENMIHEWTSREWTVSFICKTHPSKLTKLRICKKKVTRPKVDEGPIMETDCKYVNATLKNMLMWLEDNVHPDNPLKEYARSEYSCYADYNYMHELFQSESEMLEAVDWGTFGFSGRSGRESTIWIGSEGAFTPCHQDCYGFNLVAQLSGKKFWTMYSPEDSDKLYPTRVPYEESSIFSSVNLRRPDYSKHPKFREAKKYQVVLKPGDVLYVPKHWWHFVENLEPSVSVNTWIEKDGDEEDRVKEAITRILICSLKQSEGASRSTWLNPNEEVHPHQTNMKFLQLAMSKLMLNQNSESSEATEEILDCDSFINCLTSENILNAVVNEMKSRAGNS